MSGDSWALEVRALVERTCADQGVPVVVTERGVVERVSVLLGARRTRGRAHARSASTAPGRTRSEAPHGADTIDGHVAGASDAGEDLDVVDQGLDDGSLPVEVEGRPLSA